MSERADRALLDLLGALRGRGYRFVSITPASHARVVARPARTVARSLRDVFGWSLPFEPGLLPEDVLGPLEAGGMIHRQPPLARSLVRVSSLEDRLFLHSAYPTDAVDAVFFGPDSTRFAELIRTELQAAPPPPGARIVDIGCGSGVGAIVAAAAAPASAAFGTDINAKALRLARINARAAGIALETHQTSGLDDVDGVFDVALINPPYIIDDDARAYRDGGGMHGGQLSLDLATGAMTRLAPRGRVILYTGSAILDGRDPLHDALAAAAAERGCALRYREIDPDVFGEELERPAYAEVDRIALVAAILTRQR